MNPAIHYALAQPRPGRARQALRRRGRLDGVLVIVSHDRELLERVDQVADLSAGAVRMYGGNLTDYEDLLAAEQAAPTNNLDMASVRQLSQALAGYRGAILAAGHDLPFLRSVGITRWLRLDRETGMTVIEPLCAHVLAAASGVR